MTLAGIPIWKTMAVVCFPIAIAKSFISLLHLIAGSILVGRIDSDERKQSEERANK